MPHLTHATPKYRKHRASGQAIVTLGYRDFYLGPYGSRVSRNEYDRLVGEWLQQGRQLGRQFADDESGKHELCVNQLIVAYLRYAQVYYRKDGQLTSEYTAIVHALRHVKRLYGRSNVTRFGPIALQTVMQEFVVAGWARRTVNKQAGRVKRMFRWALSRELIPANVSHALSSVAGLRKGRTAARETRPVLPVDDAVIAATMEHLPEVVADMVTVHELTGMRPSEVCIMRPMDIDRSDEIWLYRPHSHKTEHHERERVVFIGPQAQGALLKYLARDAASYCFRPCDSEAKRRAARHAARKVPLHHGNRPGTNRVTKPKRSPGERYDANAYRHAIHRACDKAFPHPTLSTIPKRELTADQLSELQQWQNEAPLVAQSAQAQCRNPDPEEVWS